MGSLRTKAKAEGHQRDKLGLFSDPDPLFHPRGGWWSPESPWKFETCMHTMCNHCDRVHVLITLKMPGWVLDKTMGWEALDTPKTPICYGPQGLKHRNGLMTVLIVPSTWPGGIGPHCPLLSVIYPCSPFSLQIRHWEATSTKSPSEEGGCLLSRQSGLNSLASA